MSEDDLAMATCSTVLVVTGLATMVTYDKQFDLMSVVLFYFSLCENTVVCLLKDPGKFPCLILMYYIVHVLVMISVIAAAALYLFVYMAALYLSFFV
jgi:hypothetical protein